MWAAWKRPGLSWWCFGTVQKRKNRKGVEDLTYNEKAFQIQETAEIPSIMRGLHLLRECSRKVKKEYTENWSVKKEWTPKNSVQSTSGVLWFVCVDLEVTTAPTLEMPLSTRNSWHPRCCKKLHSEFDENLCDEKATKKEIEPPAHDIMTQFRSAVYRDNCVGTRW